MPIQLNHTIVHSPDPRTAAEFVTTLFGLPPAEPFGPFFSVKMANDVTLDYLSAGDMEDEIA